jgi:hypothetical protein
MPAQALSRCDANAIVAGTHSAQDTLEEEK